MDFGRLSHEVGVLPLWDHSDVASPTVQALANSITIFAGAGASLALFSGWPFDVLVPAGTAAGFLAGLGHVCAKKWPRQ